MKKLLLILLCLPFIGFGQKTYVPDDNFEIYLEANGYGDGDFQNDSVMTLDFGNIYYLNIENKNIADLTGIEDMSNMRSIYANRNNFHSVDFSNNTFLEYIDVSQCDSLTQIILPDSTMHSWQSDLYLNFYHCNVSSINLPERRIRGIEATNNPLTNIDVTNIEALQELRLSNTNITSLNLSNATALEYLSLENINHDLCCEF